MTRERKTQAVTIAVLAAAFAVVVGQKYGWRKPDMRLADLAPQAAAKPDPSPQDAIYAMLDAARDGNVDAYLDAYTGQIQGSLKQAVAETTREGFARYLKESNEAIKGIAISEPQALTDGEMKVRVEYVYQDRNEAQTMYVERVGDGWKIARVDGLERVKTLIPYGTPVQ
jgi:hypothetical protein